MRVTKKSSSRVIFFCGKSCKHVTHITRLDDCVAPRVGVRDSQSTLCCVAPRVEVRDSQSTLCRVAPRVGVRGSQSTLCCLNIAKLVVEHRGTFSDVPLDPMGAGFVDYVLSIVNADCAVQVVQAPGDDVEGVTELLGPLESPPAPKLKLHFRLSRRVFKPPPPHSKARRPPPSRAWKARRPSCNLPWPLPQRRTPVPRSSSVESGARCRMATQQMHLASWSVTSFSSMTCPSS